MRSQSITPLERRFWAKVAIAGPDDCWLWSAGRFQRGYGSFSVEHRSTMLAHRFAWETVNGAIPASMFVCHACDNPACVNPAHLFLGTPADNMHDKARKGRGRFPGPRSPARGEMHGSAKLTVDAVRAIRQRVAAGETWGDVALAYGVSHTQIGRIIHRQKWRHVE